jgi:hypothetical protein
MSKLLNTRTFLLLFGMLEDKIRFVLFGDIVSFIFFFFILAHFFTKKTGAYNK